MSWSKISEGVIAGVLVTCTVLVTSAVIKREFFDRTSTSVGGLPPQPLEDWARYAVGPEVIGGSAARDTIVVFSDYQCPFCRRFSETTDRLLQKYPDQIVVYHRNFPLNTIHPIARSAAIAGVCATRQGRFAAFHRYAFAHPADVLGQRWREIAESVGVSDAKGFATCLTDSSVAATLRADSLAGEELHIPGTPLVIVNGWVFTGTPDDSTVRLRLRSRAE